MSVLMPTNKGETTADALPRVKAAAVTTATRSKDAPGNSIAIVTTVGRNSQKDSPSKRMAAMTTGVL